MPARPICRFGTSDRLFRGASAGTVEALEPGDAALFGLARANAQAQAIRDASWFGRRSAAKGRRLDLGDADADAAAAAQAIRTRGGRPILLGGRIDDAASLLPAAEFASATLLVSDRLDLDPSLLGPGVKLAIGTHDLLPGRCVAAWCLAGGEMVQATGPAPLQERLAAALRKIDRPERAALIVDLRALDTGHAAGSPALNVGGLSPLECLDVIGALAAVFAIETLALVNLAPDRDARGHSELLAAEAIHLALAPVAARAAA